MSILIKEIEELLYEGAPDFKIAQVIKQELQKYYKTLPDTFKNSSGKAFLVKHTRQIDKIISTVYSVVLRDSFAHYMPLKNAIPIVLVALGSYGREQMSVKSDIDLMIVYRDLNGYNTLPMIEKILYLLWDSGLKIGHRVHEIGTLFEASNSDLTIKSAILESRYIDGSKFLWTEVENVLNQIRKTKPEEFIKAKLQERKAMQLKYPLSMEPNLKEGIGGFRDANSVYWIGKVLYNTPRIKDLSEDIVQERDYREFRIALEFLFRVRSALHILSKKKSDILRMEMLPQIAELLNIEPTPHAQMRLAKRVIDQLKAINLYSRIWISEMVTNIVPNEYNGYLMIESVGLNLSHTLKELIEYANDKPFDVHPQLLKALIHAKRPERPDLELYETIIDIFHTKYSHSILKAVWQVRLLGYLIQPLKKIISMPQFDGYHKYPVDKHSLEALRELENIQEPLLKEIYENLESEVRYLLKIVVLLHDAGKGRKKDHYSVGVSLFRIFAKKLKMSNEFIEIGSKLIQYHTLMSVTAQREDIYSEKVVMSFASRFGNKLMLDLIYLLTYADMKAVGSNVYNDFTKNLLQTLYKNSLEAIKNDTLLSETARRVTRIESLQRSSTFNELPRTLRKKILSIPSNAFFIRHTTKHIINLAQEAYKTEDYRYQIHNSEHLSIEIIRRYDLNLAWLLTQLKRLPVVSMEIVKLFDGLKYFKIDFNEKLDDDIPLIKDIIESSFQPHPKLKLTKPKIKPKEVTIDCNHSVEYATLKLRTKDQAGLLAYLIKLFDKYGIDIASAKVHTLKGRVNDLFLIEKNGNFCNNINKIEKELLESVCAE